jgi:hypothetical protein
VTLASGEVCAGALFKGLRWPLDDPLAGEIEPGRVMKLEIVVRFGEVWEYVNGRRSWRTDVLEIGDLHD